jgi:alanine dehydrogenase
MLGLKYLANPPPSEGEVLGIIGSGVQATAVLEATAAMRRPKRVVVYSRSPEHRHSFVRRWQHKYACPLEAVSSAAAVVEQADIITSATTSRTPTFDGEQVRPGAHVSAISTAELDEAILSRGSLFTSTKGRATEYLVGGESRVFGGETAVYRHWDDVGELERVMTGEIPGRHSPEEITVFLPGGAGLQYAALGHEAYQRARERGVGCELPEGALAPRRTEDGSL